MDDISIGVNAVEGYEYVGGRLNRSEEEHMKNIPRDQKIFDVIRKVGDDIHKESCFEESSSLSELGKSALYYYISGYIAFKKNISVSATELETDESEFLGEISRGRLGHPPIK